MSLRDTLNKNPRTSAALGVILFAASVGLVIWLLVSDRSGPAASAVTTRDWFSADDGATWFADDIAKPSPFQTSDGRTAVKAAVFKCSHGKTFVAYLERKDPDADKKIAAAKAKDGKSSPYANYLANSQASLEVKAPKAPQWTPISDPAAAKIITVVCPDGSQDGIEAVPAR